MDPLHLGPLAVWHHTSPAPPSARVLLIHGISEHSGRHLNTVRALENAGVETVRFDLRGAGLSGGRRQWCASFEDYVDDTAKVFHWIHLSLSPLPLFLLGHSLGGAIALHFGARYDNELAGMILSAPAFQVGQGISPLKIILAKILHRMAPTLRVPDTSDGHAISRDAQVVAAYREDPLSCHYNTVQQGTETLRALAELPSICPSIRTPVLFAHGTADEIIRLEGSFELFRAVSSSDRELHILPGGYHEPHNDLDKGEYLGIVTRWVRKQVSARSTPIRQG